MFDRAGSFNENLYSVAEHRYELLISIFFAGYTVLQVFDQLFLSSYTMTSILFRTILTRRFSSTPSLLQIKVGDKLPSIMLHKSSPGNQIDVSQLFSGKKGILFAVPGAFTPGCSKTHLPGYVQHHSDLKSKGMDIIACVSVNDAFVMDAWGKSADVGDKIEMLADTSAEFSKTIGLHFDATPVLGTRYCLYM